MEESQQQPKLNIMVQEARKSEAVPGMNQPRSHLYHMVSKAIIIDGGCDLSASQYFSFVASKQEFNLPAVFPLLLPLIISRLFTNPRTHSKTISHSRCFGSLFILTFFYFGSLGLITGGITMMYIYGLCYLHVSNFSLICTTQLTFNAVFSFFVNSQKFTALILNSVILLTISAALLVVVHLLVMLWCYPLLNICSKS